jgi:hypothetical protein
MFFYLKKTPICILAFTITPTTTISPAPTALCKSGWVKNPKFRKSCRSIFSILDKGRSPQKYLSKGEEFETIGCNEGIDG